MKALVSSLPGPQTIPGWTMFSEIKATFKQGGFQGLRKDTDGKSSQGFSPIIWFAISHSMW